MTSPLVGTKLFVPRLRRGLVARPRLRERLRLGAEVRLTLISAPAGFGKTTLLAEWLAAASSGDRPVAWLSLDKTDQDHASFWAHVISALDVAAPGIGATVSPILEARQQPDEVVLATLVNALGAVPNIIDLVLDDYHVIDRPEIQAGMAFLIEHLPPNAHVVISTRADPALPLGRLRAQGELVEIRSDDLRFTDDETASYLNGVIGLGLSGTDISALERRTEGWIAALQLAGLSMQGRGDVAGFIASFAGNDRYIVDYLVEEVLLRQSERTRSFLLRTCFLDRLSGGLCDAVTGESGGKATLDELYRKNLFVVPLDDSRGWYRYHHLFADVLLTQLDDDLRRALPVRHRRASDWYEQQGERSEAIRHALAGEWFERAAELIELAMPQMQRTRREAVVRDWLRLLPDELVRSRPVLGIGFVGALAQIGEFAQVEERLRDVEHGLAALADADAPSADSSTRYVITDSSQIGRLPATIELYRAAMAQVRGDLPDLIEHAGRVLDLAPPDDHLNRAAASALLGIAHWTAGNLADALAWWTESRNGLQRIGNIADTLGVAIALADIHLAQGHLGAAIEVYERALATVEGGPVLRGTADMHAGLCELYRQRNDAGAARRHLAACQEVGEAAGLPQHPYRWRVAAAYLRQDEGDFDGAARLLDEAERLYVGDFHPNVRPVAAIRARLSIMRGRADEALRWQRDSWLSIDQALSYRREFEHITLARLRLAQVAHDLPGDMTGVTAFLGRLLEAAERGGREGSVIEISILAALAHRHDDIDRALIHLERALNLAAPEGYVRLFIDEGQTMAPLLKMAVKRRIAPAYARTLLVAIGRPEDRPQMHPDLIEPLSERELEVLRLLRSDLGGPEIAHELMIAPNTMRTHTKNIYEKLGVNDRRSAVRRAEELDLLGRHKGH